MKTYTAHTRDGRPPRLLREGWAWGAVIFGPLWLFWSGAWIPGVLFLCAEIAASLLLPPPLAGAVQVAVAVLLGVSGRDLVRWSLARRGWLLAHVVAGTGEDLAYARLYDRRPDLAAAAAAAR